MWYTDSNFQKSPEKEAAYEKNAVLHTGCHHADGVVRVRAEAGGDEKALGRDGGFPAPMA